MNVNETESLDKDFEAGGGGRWSSESAEGKGATEPALAKGERAQRGESEQRAYSEGGEGTEAEKAKEPMIAI